MTNQLSRGRTKELLVQSWCQYTLRGLVFARFIFRKFFRHNFPLFSKKLPINKRHINRYDNEFSSIMLVIFLDKRNYVWKELYSLYCWQNLHCFEVFYWSSIRSFSLQVLNFRKRDHFLRNSKIYNFVLTKISPVKIK